MKVYDSQGRLKTIVAGASAQPTSGQFSALSNQVSVQDAALSVRVNSVNAFLSGISARSVGNVSTHGVQSVIDALSNRISAIGGTSVTSAELSAGLAATSAQAASAVNVVSARVVSVSAELASLIQVASAAATSADAHANTVSARVVSVSAELASLIQIASAAATSADNHANTASDAATSADNHANTVSARVVSVSAELASLVQIASAAATSADAHANAASAAATSADNHANTVSARVVSVSAELASLINIVSARVVSVSAELGSLIQIASAAATSADAHANTVSARVVSVSAELVSLLNSVEARLSDRIDAIPGGGSTNVVRIRSNVVSVISGAALVNVEGLSVSVSVGVLYKLEGALMFEKGTSGGAAFGLSLPPLAAGGSFVEMTVARLLNQRGNMEASTIQDRFWGVAAFSAVAAAQTAVVSVSITDVNVMRACNVVGMILASATGVIQLMARGSVAGDSMSVRAGFIRVLRLG